MEHSKIIIESIKASAKAYGIKGTEVIEKTQRPVVTKAKSTAIHIMREHFGLSERVICVALQYSKNSNVKHMNNSAKERIAKGGEFAERHNQALDYLALTASV